MKQQNIDYYNQNADDFFESTLSVDMQPLYDEFLPLVTPKGNILDAGCGSGRDSKAFSELGFNITSMDASESLASLATQYLGFPVICQTFQNINFQNQFDGIWCCASLLHVPLIELPDVMIKLNRALRLNGVIYMSFKLAYTKQSERSHNGRIFTDLDENSLHKFIEAIPELAIKKIWITADQRPSRIDEKWLNAIIVKVDSHNE